MLGNWIQEAACAGLDTESFYLNEATATSEELSPMLRVCATCPVREECFDYAMAAPEWHGIWGGFTTAERARRGMRPPKREVDWALAWKQSRLREVEIQADEAV